MIKSNFNLRIEFLMVLDDERRSPKGRFVVNVYFEGLPFRVARQDEDFDYDNCWEVVLL